MVPSGLLPLYYLMLEGRLKAASTYNRGIKAA